VLHTFDRRRTNLSIFWWNRWLGIRWYSEVWGRHFLCGNKIWGHNKCIIKYILKISYSFLILNFRWTDFTIKQATLNYLIWRKERRTRQAKSKYCCHESKNVHRIWSIWTLCSISISSQIPPSVYCLYFDLNFLINLIQQKTYFKIFLPNDNKKFLSAITFLNSNLSEKSDIFRFNCHCHHDEGNRNIIYFIRIWFR
jgi:hypothetical protein